VDSRTSRELRAIAKGRIAFIDYVAYAGIRGLRVGRIRLRWLDALEPIPRSCCPRCRYLRACPHPCRTGPGDGPGTGGVDGLGSHVAWAPWAL